MIFFRARSRFRRWVGHFCSHAEGGTNRPGGQVGHVLCTFPSLYDAGPLIVDFPLNAKDMMIRYIF